MHIHVYAMHRQVYIVCVVHTKYSSTTCRYSVLPRPFQLSGRLALLLPHNDIHKLLLAELAKPQVVGNEIHEVFTMWLLACMWLAWLEQAEYSINDTDYNIFVLWMRGRPFYTVSRGEETSYNSSKHGKSCIDPSCTVSTLLIVTSLF